MSSGVSDTVELLSETMTSNEVDSLTRLYRRGHFGAAHNPRGS